jgi:hypothetical protein
MQSSILARRVNSTALHAALARVGGNSEGGGGAKGVGHLQPVFASRDSNPFRTIQQNGSEQYNKMEGMVSGITIGMAKKQAAV